MMIGQARKPYTINPDPFLSHGATALEIEPSSIMHPKTLDQRVSCFKCATRSLL